MLNLEELKLYIVSDSLGETAEMVVRAAISQFKTLQLKIAMVHMPLNLQVSKTVRFEIVKFQDFDIPKANSQVRQFN